MLSCPNCGTMTADIICENCNYLIQKNDITNFFDIFSFTGRLGFDQDEIDSRFYSLSKQIHPDLHENKDDLQKKLSIQYSSLLNNAYQTLINPFKRAKYFLEIHNDVALSKDIPQQLLADVFEVQELLESNTLDDDEIEELGSQLNKFDRNIQESKDLLEAQFKTYDLEKNLSETISGIKKILLEYNYLKRLSTQIEEKIESE
jgi:molecular chaperone HscB